jgi:hypothetical protein
MMCWTFFLFDYLNAERLIVFKSTLKYKVNTFLQTLQEKSLKKYHWIGLRKNSLRR